MKVIDFTDIDIYPRYWVNFKGGERFFTIRALVIEDIDRQQEVLTSKKTTLLVGDCIEVKTHFGYNTAKSSDPERWIDIPLEGCFRVLQIIPLPETNEIEMKVKAV